MVEVFKTDVESTDHARILVDHIHKTFSGYRANFDLQDCDRILRVSSAHPIIDTDGLIDLLDELGYHAEILSDHSPETAVPLGCYISTLRRTANKFSYQNTIEQR
jgi:hypothetical protein